MNHVTRRATLRILIGSGIGAVGGAVNFVLCMHSTSPDAPLSAKVWLALGGFSLLIGLWRVVWYRNRRDYFAEEMNYRHTLAKGINKS